ncbi:hypothetical protein TRFO_23875 [Tritrichomonas foetus]|uniref:Beige/BEACH domain containing protein n=1 Tax=Tritrichomonas foetus TaxID=1144522 RepID=A0A1J4KE91_9EUKA|nr:hypothetical protein TRFO_23875 [Tritrichomonas foetus]|eukprot:OHT07773.1 hypothetical protein TRFO_23875 [Tritrichomonas foetus]
MSQHDVILSMVEAISCNFTNFDQAGQEFQIQMIFQTIPFFNEIFSLLNPQYAHQLVELHKVANEYLKGCNRCIYSIAKEGADLDRFVDFLNGLILSCLVSECIDSVTQLLVGILNIRDIPSDRLKLFEKPFQSFFQYPDLRSELTKHDGLLTAWFTYVSEPENPLVSYLFLLFSQYLEFFVLPDFIPHITDLIAAVSASFPTLSLTNAQFIIELFQKLVSLDPKLYIQKLEENLMFHSLRDFIVLHQDEDPELISYLEFFNTLIPLQTNIKVPSLDMIISLISSEDCKTPLRHRALEGIENLLRYITAENLPFTADQIALIANSIPLNDEQSVYTFSTICLNLNIQANFDLSPIIQYLQRFVTFELLLNVDMTKYISLFLCYQQEISPFIPKFYSSIFVKVDTKLFAKIVNKYDHLFAFLIQHFEEPLSMDQLQTFLTTLIASIPYYENIGSAKSCLQNIITSKKGYLFTQQIFNSIDEIAAEEYDVSELVTCLTVTAQESSFFRIECIRQKVYLMLLEFHKNYETNNCVILDFIAVLSKHRYISSLDVAVYEKLVEVDLLQADSDQLLRFALGLKQNQDFEDGTLCFPSILGYCTDYVFTSRYDLWVCGRIGLGSWLKDSGRPISEFPSITAVASQYAKLEHLEMLINYPEIFYQTCLNLSQLPPLFEFPKKYNSSFGAVYESMKSLCFWFQVSENSEEQTSFISIGSSQLYFQNKEIKYDNNTVSPFDTGKWTFFSLFFDQTGMCSILIDNKNVFNFKPTASKKTVTFGGKNCAVAWYIGGVIRFFNEQVTLETFSRIRSLGVASSKSEGESQRKYALTSAPLWGPVANANNPDRKERAISIFSLLNYLQIVKIKPTFIFTRAIELSQTGDSAGANFLLKSLCVLKKNNFFSQSNESFSLSISVLFHTYQDILTNDTIDLILDCYETNGGYDWNSFFVFAFDHALLFSKHAVIFVSKFFELIARYPIEQESSKYAFTLYLFSLMSISEFDHSLNPSILDFVEKLNPECSLILYLLASYPEMATNITDNSIPYTIDPEDITIQYILTLISRLKITKFRHYFLFNVLPSTACCSLANILVKQKVEAIDYDTIFECLLYNCFMPDAWFCAISICTHSTIEDLHNFSIANFDMTFMEHFLKMYTILICACFHLNIESFWVRFAAFLTEQLIYIVPNIPERCFHNKSTKFWLIQMMTFGQHFDKMSSFPPYPLAFTSEDILAYIEMRGHSYPTNYGKPYTFQQIEIDFNKKCSLNHISKFVYQISPKEICLNGVAKYQVQQRHTQAFNEIYETNKTVAATDWVNFIHELISRFDIEQNSIHVDQHPLTDILIRLLSTFVVNCPALFQTIFNTMSIFPNDLMMLQVRKIIICSLNICEQRKMYHNHLLDIACKRALEGWFPSQYIDVLSRIFNIASQNLNDPNFSLPVSFYDAIIFGFDVVQLDDIPRLMKLVSENKQYFVQPSLFLNFDLCFAFMGKMLSIVHTLPETFFPLWKYFVETIEQSDQFSLSWSKNVTNFDLNDLLTPIKLLGNEGTDKFMKWKVSNPSFTQIESMLYDRMNSYRAQVLSATAVSLDNLMKTRNENSIEFVKFTNKLILDRSQKLTNDKTIAACSRHIFREYYLFINSFFIRRREALVSVTFPLKFKESNRKGITILADPLYPTRRLEKSPLSYCLPSFPDGSDKELFPLKPSQEFDTGYYSKAISDLFTFCCVQSQFLVQFSPHSIHVMFSQFLPIKPYQNLIILQIMLNKGVPFSYSCNCHLLYGVDTVPGALFLSENTMYFAEGFSVEDDGFTFTHTVDFAPHQFYMHNILTNHFGPFRLFQGHPIIEWPFADIVAAYPHIWIHKPYSIALNFVRGFNFVLNFKKTEYNYIFPILKKYASQFYETAPPPTSVNSPVNSGRLLQLTHKEAMQKWTNGEIDTFTYLCLLNRFGKRLTCDLTQYYVFPWIISDYESQTLENAPIESFRDLKLPMGQIGKERSERFNEFFRDTDFQYYYGTHYMHFGVVLYFMFRIDPFTFFWFLLHKGWDHPNRIFNDLAEAWMMAAFNSPSDIKEVIPQFFTVPELFENISSLPLTVNDEGKSISEVKLPKWAKNSRDLTTQLMQNLESERIIKQINHWIDLIFGEKSRGSGAKEAKNLFHPLCYANTKNDIEEESEDLVEREANITCIINFGQCPQQVTSKPHPQLKTPKTWKTLVSSSQSASQPVVVNHNWQKLRSEQFLMPATASFADNSNILTINQQIGAFLPTGQFIFVKEGCISLVNKGMNESIKLVSNDSFLSISSISISPDGLYMIMARREGSVLLVRLSYNKGEAKSAKIIKIFSTESEIVSVACSSEHFLALACCKNKILQFDIGLFTPLPLIELDFQVKNVEIDENAALIVAYGDHDIAVLSISGQLLIKHSVKPLISCITMSKLPEYFEDRFFVTGHNDGSVIFWKVSFSENNIMEIGSNQLSIDPISTVVLSPNSQRLFVTTKLETFCCECIGSSCSPLKKELYSCECASCSSDIQKNSQVCSKCGRFVCMKCITKEMNALKTTYTCILCQPPAQDSNNSSPSGVKRRNSVMNRGEDM